MLLCGIRCEKRCIVPTAIAITNKHDAGMRGGIELAVPQTHGGKIADALARRMMVHDGVLRLGRNPHAATRPLLLKVNFVQCPEVHSGIAHQLAEFFLWVFCRVGSALAKTGRGLRRRNSNCRNKRWHWRTPRWTP